MGVVRPKYTERTSHDGRYRFRKIEVCPKHGEHLLTPSPFEGEGWGGGLCPSQPSEALGWAVLRGWAERGGTTPCWER